MVWPDIKTFTLLLTLALFVTGGITGLFLRPQSLNRRLRSRLALGCALAGSLLIAFGSASFWFWGQPAGEGEAVIPLVLTIPAGFPPLNLDLFVDRLAAFFLFLTGLLSAGVALYSFVWLEDKKEQSSIAGVYNLFVLSTLLLVVVNNVYLFLIFLECMTLCFGYLTLYRHNTLLAPEQNTVDPRQMQAAKRAFKVYLVFSHVGVIFITAALILLALAAGDFSFDVLRKSNLEAGPVLANTIFLLTLTGFGIKAAIAPAHLWMGLTHPYLPTSIHALVSSIIIKVAGIYGLIRVFFEFLAPAPWWWGPVIPEKTGRRRGMPGSSRGSGGISACNPC